MQVLKLKYLFLHNSFLVNYSNEIDHLFSGKYVPELAELIHDRNKDPSLYIDLKGILVWSYIN